MVNIRPVRKDEVQKFQDLNDEIFIDNSKYDPDLKIDWAQSSFGRDYFTEALNNPESICFLAEENDNAIGYIFAAPKLNNSRLSKYIEIENMGVSPDYRSKGIGHQLIEKVLEDAKKKGFQRICVNSYSDNIKAIDFYEKNGFKKIDVSLERDI
ncbi:MAG TPA: GNAT family N-acetyltransferase [Patescibacteria group bacterium]|nr:GNAT family N-acetyltransferase [Patescibacteria group bacterium]